MIAKYDDKEKRAIVGVLAAIIYADGFVDPGKVDYGALVMYELGLPHNFLENGLGVGPEEAFEIIRSMDDERKAIVREFLKRMLYADKSKPHKHELRVFGEILDRCGIDRS